MIRGALLALLLVGCGDRAATENEAVAVGRVYLADKYPPNPTVEAIDMGDRWRLLFTHPEVGTGGLYLIIVNKRSGEIVHAETQQ